jgi:glutathione peroxidase
MGRLGNKLKLAAGMLTGIGTARTSGTGIPLHGIAVTARDGHAVSLGDYAGQVLLLVNVASRCGFTPQYKGLVALQDEFGPRGFTVLGFPCNDFGAQEPGTADDAAAACTISFGLNFPLFEKVAMTGPGATPLYAALQSSENGPFAGEVTWNFTKFLAGRDGYVCARFEPTVKPESSAFHAAIEQALAAPPT